MAAYNSGRYAEAESDINTVLPSYRTNFQVQELAGLIEAALGHDDSANPYLRKAIELRPTVAGARTALALNLVRLHRMREAEAQFHKAVDLDPQSHESNHNLGEFYIRAGRLKEAIPYLSRAEQIDPQDYNNGFDLALACERTGSLDAARSELQRLLAINDTAEAHSLLGEIEEKQRNYVAAASQYEAAARMDPSEANVFALGAEMLIHQTFEPAVAVFKSGIARYPESTRLALGLGVALYGSGQYDESAQQFFQVADRNPGNVLPLIFLGRAYDNFSSNTATQVRERLQSAVQAFPRNPELPYFYALSLWKESQDRTAQVSFDTIESLLKRAVALDPKYGDAYLQLGIVYAHEQKYSEAIAQYRRALRTSTNSATIHYRLGQALVRLGDSTQAQREFDQFERLRTSETDARNKQTADIQQFVYTMKAPEESQ
jgi:tetratricopeptide (TPR) repeat protein